MADDAESKLDLSDKAETPDRSFAKSEKESAIGDSSRQNVWTLANEITHQDDVHPSEVEGMKAVSTFGIDFGDGSILTANGLKPSDSIDRSEELTPESAPAPAVLTAKMMAVADREHDHPTRYRGPLRKCNQFVDKVTHDAGMRVPWKAGSPPRSFEMNALLEKSKDFERVWQADYSNEALSLENFQTFEMQPGDLVIWGVPDSVVKGGISHGGIATSGRMIIYAGSAESRNGCGHCDIINFTGTPVNPLNYGPPTGIYRYRHMTR